LVAKDEVAGISFLLANPGLETWDTLLAYWITDAQDGTIAQETTAIHGGASAVKITTGVGKATRIYQQVTVVPGDSYTFSVWTRGDGSHQGRVIIKTANGASVNIVAANTGVPGTTYALYSVAFAIPSDCSRITINLYNSIGTAGDVVYFDDCSLITVGAYPYGSGAYMNGALYGQVSGYEGLPCAFLDGTDDLIPLTSPYFYDNFNPLEGTAIVLGKVALAAWSDAATRYLFRIKTLGDTDAVTFGKLNTNNTIFFQWLANTVDNTFTLGNLTETEWIMLGMTWSQRDNFVRCYYNFLPITGASAAYQAWSARTINAAKALVGAETLSSPTNAWIGWVNHISIATRALSNAEMASLG
jgi:hypothetical protein